MDNRAVVGGLIVLFVGLTARDIFFGDASEMNEDTSSIELDHPNQDRKKEIPKSNLRNLMAGPTLKVLYWLVFACNKFKSNLEVP